MPRPTSTPWPTSTLPPEVEIEAALWRYIEVVADAEEMRNPGEVSHVCVEPCLSEKDQQIGRDSSAGHWETWAMTMDVVQLSVAGDQATASTHQAETRVFIPDAGPLPHRPDDEVCQGPIRSYRNCSYEARYTLVRREGRWYVSEVETTAGGCPHKCRPPTEGAVVDGAGPGGVGLSLALDAAGRAHIAYYDRDEGALRYTIHTPETPGAAAPLPPATARPTASRTRTAAPTPTFSPAATARPTAAPIRTVSPTPVLSPTVRLTAPLRRQRPPRRLSPNPR